jgi:beta-mannosidase
MPIALTSSPRRPLTAWALAAAPPGTAREGVTGWRPTTAPNTAAGGLRDLGAYSLDRPADLARAFDAEDWWWRGTIDEGPAPGARAILGLDGLATLAEVWLDDALILTSDSMFARHEVDVTAHLRAGSELRIRCRALSPELASKKGRPRWRVPMLEQQQLRFVRTTLLGRTPGWSPPAPAVGPWRPVWLEQRRGPVVVDRTVRATLDGDDGLVTVAATLADADAATLVVADADGATLARAALTQAADGRWHGAARVAQPARWWPHTHGAPTRHAITLELTHGEATTPLALGHVGFRTVTVDRAAGGFAVEVNGVPVFCRGACWSPLDPITLRHSPAEVAAAIAQVAAAGMNMLRVSGAMVYEDDAFYDALDAHGVLLWQDLMFANMDYPDDAGFAARAVAEVDAELARLAHRPCLAVVCGNSEGGQQAAMWGAPRDRWQPPLFHAAGPGALPAAVAARCPDVAYVPSSTDGGAFPHAADAGPTSYYGVGAYRRPLDDARRADVRFASECLAFANIPAEPGLPPGAPRVHDPRWKARVPRDLGAGWDFDDVRDHYVAARFAVDPAALRAADHERYLALGRATTGEVMAAAFAEWRRPGSRCGGALIWLLRDLWPGAGWGVVDATGAPKPAWYALRRALAPTALTITDEGVNGLALHVHHDRPSPLAATLALTLYRGGETQVGRATAPLALPGHGQITLAAAALFDHWIDLAYAYRFGPPSVDLVHATLIVDQAVIAEAFHHPAGPPRRDHDVGLTATATPTTLASGEDGYALTLRARRHAHAVTLDAPGFVADDDHLHLAPGQVRVVHVRRTTARGPLRGAALALNAERAAPIEVA